MGKILIPGSGGGTDLDVITAGAGDVLAPKVIVDRDGEPVVGTLALDGNASPADVRSGRTYYGTDAKTRMTGTMAEKGAAAYTPGSYNQVIGAGQYLAGEQTILGDGNLASQYIKKGVTIFGVTGSFEGWVPTPQDLYYNGALRNDCGLVVNTAFWRPENTRLYCPRTDDYGMDGRILKSLIGNFDIKSYSRLLIYGYFQKQQHNTGSFSASTDIGQLRAPGSTNEQTMFAIDISQASIFKNEAANTIFGGGFLMADWSTTLAGNYITRIRLE